MMRRSRLGFALTLLASCLAGVDVCSAQEAQPLSVEQRQALDAAQRDLERALDGLRGRVGLADAAVYQKGLAWALRYDQQFTPADVRLLEQAADRGRERAAALADGQQPWAAQRGKVVLGYFSRIDGSAQPYGVVVPEDYDPAQPIRLDVVLHGSTRPVGLSELRFMSRFEGGGAPPRQPFIELHPLGRVENCYRWAGETDVFEAIDDVCRRYRIDRDRIVLRGMSMGASGTWHLGLKHPDRFVALGPYCGYVDTHRFSETPLPNFVKVGPLPPHQELGLHMLDSIDYAANAGVVPAIACMGEKDVFFQAHVLMGEAFEREGLQLVNLISPGTGHVVDPATHAEQLRRIGAYAAQGLNRQPEQLRFVTWTLKYSRCHWLQVLGLERHYARAEVAARRTGDVVAVTHLQNVTRFALLPQHWTTPPQRVRIGSDELAWPAASAASSPGVVFVRRGEKWEVAGELGRVALEGKRPGLQGPIDDAFAEPFLCVRGTGRPWNAAVQAYADASLERFQEEWRHYFRGELPLKDDVAVTDEDVRTRHLILFGDPGSNRWIAQALPQLPLQWSPETLRLGGRDDSARDHVPALIAPNPLPGGAGRYVVLNSGHTFREAELAKLNYLLFPRWGDWAVLQIDPAQPAPTPLAENVVAAGYFNEQWRTDE